jgi:hypothetical protein
MISDLDRAIHLVERNSTLWHDFCSSIGMIPGNVAHMRGIRERFAEWLKENE